MTRCQACEDGRHAECGRQSWCACECEGAITMEDVSALDDETGLCYGCGKSYEACICRIDTAK